MLTFMLRFVWNHFSRDILMPLCFVVLVNVPFLPHKQIQFVWNLLLNGSIYFKIRQYIYSLTHSDPYGVVDEAKQNNYIYCL